jgi:2-keto-4-pentenoate hydratase/2-oxohepta-3-ene-1,7-dioic acid hydratase in catechol pathway
MNKYIRFETTEGLNWGIIGEEGISKISSNPALGDYKDEGIFYEHSQVKLQAPVEPSKIVCVGLNYTEHVKESQSADEVPDEPVIFLKPPSSLIGPGEKIILPEMADRVDYEAELGVVIGRECHNVAAVEAEDYIFGFTCVNDVTARDLQKKDVQWTRGKGFDTFCPVGPWIVDNLNYKDIQVESYLNGDLKQSSRTSLQIFKVPVLISFISKVMTLFPGDLISTGTPAGISPMSSGDRIEIRIEGIGSLVNDVI